MLSKYIFKLGLLYSFIVTIEGIISNISIPLNRTIDYQNKQLYEDIVYLNESSTLQINFLPITKPSNLSFIIIQVHTHLYNVTLYKNNFDPNNTISGTNIGLYSNVKELSSYYVLNENNVKLKLFIAVQGYMIGDPIPGGCNMEFKVLIAPFMYTHYYDDYILVDTAPAQIDANCLALKAIYVEFYLVYLPEQNLGSDAYFDAIMNMTTLDNIQRVGRLIPKTYWTYRRMLSAYPGTGAVYVAVAYNLAKKDSYSVYVPNHSYGCDPLNYGDCDLLKDSLSEFMCATLFFIGLFICYFGHRFFKMQTFLIGFLSGLVGTYILISLLITMDRSAILFASAISGIFIGAIRTLYWWLYGIPVFSIILTSADIGFLTSSLCYYVLPGATPYFTLDLNFWLLFMLIMLLVTLLLVLTSTIANLLCCATIGAYATIYSMDVYLGSNLKYILINVIRRATVKKFNWAILLPPFQIKDCLLTVFWVLLLSSGFVYQYIENKGRPPFPPPPRSVRGVQEMPAPVAGPSGYRRLLSRHFSSSLGVNERTPLLTDSNT